MIEFDIARLLSVILTPEGFPKDDFLSDFAAGPPVHHISMRWIIFHERERERCQGDLVVEVVNNIFTQRKQVRQKEVGLMVQVLVGFMRPLFGEDTIEEGIIRATIWAQSCFVVSKFVLIKEGYTLFLVPVN